MSADTTTHNVEITRVFDAPPERVWQAWSDPDLLMRWWGPTGFTSPLAEVDCREGGTTLVCMRAPAEYGGMDMYNTWAYSAIEPYRRIEFVQHFSGPDRTPFDPATMPGMPPGIPFAVRHVITFAPLDGGRTAMTVTEYGYTTREAHDLSKPGMEQCLDKMAAIFG
jgi:uncharacterized protein YndB with AHSA1/START domain